MGRLIFLVLTSISSYHISEKISYRNFQDISRYCNALLLHGNLHSTKIQPFANTLLPTFIIFVSNFSNQRKWSYNDYAEHEKFAIDIFRTRLSTCLVTLFPYSFLHDVNETEFRKWPRFGTDQRFRFTTMDDRKSWVASTSNIYVILVTNYGKDELAKVQLSHHFIEVSRKLWNPGYP